MIEWCNKNQGFAMVLLTLVYVLATIAICIFNYKSAKATSEQTKESKRQFEEENRAFLTVTMQKLKNGLITLCFENHGKKIAQNIKIDINKEFVEILNDKDAKECINNLLNSCFEVGIGQKWYVFLDTSMNLSKISKEKMEICVTYKDDIKIYKEYKIIDFAQYRWPLLNDSDITDIRDSIKKQADLIKSIDISMGKISNIMEESSNANNK